MLVCNHCSNRSEVKKSNLALSTGSFIPIDTINIDYDGEVLLPVDWLNNKVVYFDFFAPEILISDLEGNVTSRFNVSLMGANDLGTQIYGVTFIDNSTLAIVTENGYYITDLEGNVSERYLHPFDLRTGVYLNGDFHLDYDPTHRALISLLKTTSTSRMDRPDFYKDLRHLTVFSLESREYQVRIPYEQGSYYLNGEYFNNDFGAHFAIHDKNVSLIYPLDSKVYTYSLDDYRLLRSFETEPDSFQHAVKFPFGGGEVKAKERLTGYANSVNYRIFTEGDTIIHSYTSGIPLSFFDAVNSMDDYNAGFYKHLSYYLQMFVNGEKRFSDFKLPREFPMICLYSKGTMLLLEQEKWRSQHSDFKRFLYGRVTIGPPSDTVQILE